MTIQGELTHAPSITRLCARFLCCILHIYIYIIYITLYSEPVNYHAMKLHQRFYSSLVLSTVTCKITVRITNALRAINHNMVSIGCVVGAIMGSMLVLSTITWYSK